ncbi:MAG: hypothetical protein RL518_452 [Pseudomonadota bacterium]
MRNVHALSLLCASLVSGAWCHAQSEVVATPFTRSSLIEAQELDSERLKTLNEFVRLSPDKQSRSALSRGFCKPVITQPTPSPEHVKLALALVESDIAAVISLGSQDTDPNQGTPVRYSIEFDLDHVTLRSSSPRYQSQATGLRVAYPHDSSLPVWFESKGGGGVLFMVPPVRDCSVQFVVACPRTYSNSRTLDDSKLTVTGVKYVISSKADGLFQAINGEERKVVASTLATERVPLPSPWFSENISKETPNSSIRVQKQLDPLSAPGVFSPVTAPFRDAVEAHLEFGTTSSVQRVVRSRATVELAPFAIESSQPIRIERSDVPLTPGSCIVISRRKETHY